MMTGPMDREAAFLGCILFFCNFHPRATFLKEQYFYYLVESELELECLYVRQQFFIIFMTID